MDRFARPFQSGEMGAKGAMYVQRNRQSPAAAFGALLAAVAVFAVLAAATISIGGRKHDNLAAGALFAAWGLVAGAVFAGFAPGRRTVGTSVLAPLLASGAALTAAGIEASGQTLGERLDFNGLGVLTPLLVGVYAFVAVLGGTVVGAILAPDLTQLGGAGAFSVVSWARLGVLGIAAAAAIVWWRGHGVRASIDLTQDVAALQAYVDDGFLPSVMSGGQRVRWDRNVRIGSRQSMEIQGTLGRGTVWASLLPQGRMASVTILLPLDQRANIAPGERLLQPPGLWQGPLPADLLADLGVRRDFLAALRPAEAGIWEHTGWPGQCNLSLSGGTCCITRQRGGVARLP